MATVADTSLTHMSEETADLLVFYKPIPETVVKKCERLRARIYVHEDTLADDLKKVCELLAPFGAFKEWCRLTGIEYAHAMYLVNIRSHVLEERPSKSNRTDIQITDCCAES